MASKVIFSEVRGTVVMAGTPIPGAVIERQYRWSWNRSEGTDRVVSGADGTFRLPAIEKRSLLGSLLPHEPVIYQKIFISLGGKSHEAWNTVKRNYDVNGELSGRPILLQCDLGAQPHRTDIDADGTGFFGVCDLRSGE